MVSVCGRIFCVPHVHFTLLRDGAGAGVLDGGAVITDALIPGEIFCFVLPAHTHTHTSFRMSTRAVLVGTCVGGLVGGTFGHAVSRGRATLASNLSTPPPLSPEGASIAEDLDAILTAPHSEDVALACTQLIQSVDAISQRARALSRDGVPRDVLGAQIIAAATRESTAVFEATVRLEKVAADNVFWRHVAEVPIALARDTANRKLRYIVDTATPAVGVPPMRALK